MVVTVQYTTQLKAALGIDQELIELDDDATFASLLKQLEKQHGSSFADLVLLADGRLLPSILRIKVTLTVVMMNYCVVSWYRSVTNTE